VQCHTEGGIGPFELLTYEETTAVGERVRDATRDRIMPPFLAEESDDCNHWDNFRGLSQDEIDLIEAWYEGGMQEGDPSIPTPEIVAPPSLGRVDLSLSLPEYGLNTSVDDDYRCFVVDTGTASDSFVTGFEVRPGNLSRVHHVIVYNPGSDGAVAEARALDAESPEPGYPCFGGARVNATPIVLWAPGTGATHYPTGTGLPLAAGRAQVVQVHYNILAGMGETDSTTVDLQLSSAAIPAAVVPMGDYSLNIPPRTAEWEETATQGLRPLFGSLPAGIDTLHVYAAFPHMHTLGVSMRLTQHTPSGDRCMVNIPRWDFNWQLAYMMSEPMAITADDSISITCHFNSMSRDTVTNWGDGTQDEMCLNYFYVSL
jgi:hypothetical protein